MKLSRLQLFDNFCLPELGTSTSAFVSVANLESCAKSGSVSTFARRSPSAKTGTTWVLNQADQVTVNCGFRRSRIKIYLKQDRALRVQTVSNDPADLGCKRDLQAQARAYPVIWRSVLAYAALRYSPTSRRETADIRSGVIATAWPGGATGFLMGNSEAMMTKSRAGMLAGSTAEEAALNHAIAVADVFHDAG